MSKSGKPGMLKTVIVIGAAAIVIGGLVSYAFGSVLYDFVNKHFQVDRECTVTSAELDNSNVGGGQASVGRKSINLSTTDCGKAYIDNVSGQNISFEELTKIINKHKGEKLSLSVGILDWDHRTYVRKVNKLDSLRDS